MIDADMDAAAQVADAEAALREATAVANAAAAAAAVAAQTAALATAARAAQLQGGAVPPLMTTSLQSLGRPGEVYTIERGFV